jgi:transglutaminase-like putative cysteine protease
MRAIAVSIRHSLLSLITFAAIMLPGLAANGACVLTITKVTPCLSTGAPGTPEIGATYGVRVTFNVAGTPAAPFGIKFTLANTTHTFNGISLKAGKGYSYYFLSNMCLDDAIPYSVTLDPANVSGNTNSHTTVTGTFSPAAPATIVQSYSPATKHGAVSRTVTFAPGATLSYLYALLGVPTTHGAQTVVTTTAPVSGTAVTTPPYNLAVYQVLDSNVPSGSFTFSNAFTVKLSNMRVNPKLLRKITWAQMTGLSADYTQWLAADSINESGDPAIATFVSQVLGTGYQATMTPYDAARTLHRAVMKSLTYVEPPPYRDAVSSLNAGEGDCGSYSAILVSALRYIGIPARRISGFWQGFSQSHVRVEFYMPGAGWLVADPTLGNGADPTGTYAYYFGSVNDGNQFVAVDVGDSHEMSFNSIDAQDLQTPNFWYYYTSGPAPTIASDTQFSYLQTNATDEYTLLLKPGSTGAGIPLGSGYALLTMSSTGGIIMSGQLADGASFSTTGSLGGDGGDQFIFDTPVAYSGAQGALSGTLNFVTTTGPFETSGTGDVGGTMEWTHPAQSSRNFGSSFNVGLNAGGSLYVPPAAGASALPGFTVGTLTLSGSGALTAAGPTTLTKDVRLSAANAFVVTNPATDRLKITLTLSTGVFKGTFSDYMPGVAKPVVNSVTGVVLQQLSDGGGFFTGSDNAGTVTLTP